MPDLEAAVDELYKAPLDEFTRARNELARRLAKEDRDAAEQVKGLRKPTLATWTLNQLARNEPKEVKALLGAGDELRRAQRDALSGGGGDEVRSAASARAAAVRDVVEAARRLLAAAGLKATGTTLERVATTARAASIDEDGRHLLERGRLSEELEAGGFEALGPLEAAPQPRRKTAPAKKEAPRAAADRRRRVRELEAEARRLDRDAQAAERGADNAEAAAEKARERAAAARAEADAAEAAAAEARAELS